MNANWMGATGSMKDGMKPWADLMTVGSHAFEEMTRAHMDAMTEIFETGMAHAKGLGASRDLPALARAQTEYLTEVGKCMFTLVQKEMEILTRTQTQLMSTVDGAVREGAEKVRRGTKAAADAA